MSGEQARDPRRTTFLKVNIRSDHGWTEAIVCNISAHGMMLRGDSLPGRGSFVEIASGPVAMAGQVRWSLAGRCGIRTREMIDLAALIGEQARGETLAVPGGAKAAYATGPRSRPAADGKAVARALDFGLTLALLVGGAWLLGTAVTGMLGRPMARIDSELSSPAS